MPRRRLLALSLALLGWALPSLAAAQASLVRDVNPSPPDGSSSTVALNNFFSLGPRAVFTVSRRTEEVSSIEIWTSDGTEAGTGTLLALPEESGLGFLASNGRIAFFSTGSSFVPGVEPMLWRTDGTEAGTVLLARGTAFSSEPPAFLGDSIVFSGCQLLLEAFRCEPWGSDGTAAGTRRLRDITPGEYGSNPRNFVLAGGFVYFFADAPGGTGLWRTDGTPQGTRRVALLPTFTRPINLTAAGSRLFFRAGVDFSTQNSLWTSDGTPQGTRPVPPFDRPGGRGPGAGPRIGALGNTLVFLGFDPVLGSQIYRTDGTARGTVRLTSFPKSSFSTGPGANLGSRLVFQGPDQRLWTTAGTRASTRALEPLAIATEFNLPVFFVTQGRAVFAGSTLGPEKDVEPWVTDGTPAGTFRLADLCPGECSTFLRFGATLLGQVQFYSGGDLWGTDGTPGGTRLLARGAIPPGNEQPRPLLAAARRRLVFAGFDPEAARQGKFTLELKVTNGTPEGTRILDPFRLNGEGSNPKGFTPLGDDVFFFACSSLGFEWKTDGTPETTVPLGEGRIFCDDPTLPPPVILDGIAYFRASAPTEFWDEVWRSDGTPAGTYPITNVGPAMDVSALTALDGKLFFFTDVVNGDPSTAVSTLWRSDGTPEGTVEVFKLGVRYFNSLTTVGDRMFFVAGLPNDSPMLFVSDGTQAGTRPLVISGGAGDFVELGGQIFFLSGEVIWKTDGTPEGTRQLVPPGNRVEIAPDLAVFGGRLYFMGLDIIDPENSDGVPTLFRSDGTSAGTVRFKTFDKDDTGLLPEFPLPRFTNAAGTLFFVAHDKAHGSELWKTDGTPAGTAGTVLVRDIRPGPASSRIGMIAAAGDRIFFAADDGAHGVELWTSDGTAMGTRLAADVAEGPRSSFPRQIVRIGNRVFFSADDGVVGREPWVLPLDSSLPGRIIP
ncbi:MAG TPA: hypothetical protein VHC97_01795 [Thermoanaerobaculia bacterium]|jgi:ELWxxDGT repeat protein|nr:hypothetical protein [Thermoanaerobaculia bacterium]